jgi:hypothetical protein
MPFKKLVFTIAFFAVFGLTSTALAHTDHQLDQWRDEWIEEARVAITPALIEEWAEMVESHPEYFIMESYEPQYQAQKFVPSRNDWGDQVEQWRPLVAGQFAPDEIPTAMCLIYHESRGNPTADNPRSSASGLFQILRGWWDGEWNLDPFVPEYNVWMAKQIKEIQGWYAWSPYKRGLCRGL